MSPGEYNPDEGTSIPFCLVCGHYDCECPPEEEQSKQADRFWEEQASFYPKEEEK